MLPRDEERAREWRDFLARFWDEVAQARAPAVRERALQQYRTEKAGIIHAGVGKASFSEDQLEALEEHQDSQRQMFKLSTQLFNIGAEQTGEDE